MSFWSENGTVCLDPPRLRVNLQNYNTHGKTIHFKINNELKLSTT